MRCTFDHVVPSASTHVPSVGADLDVHVAVEVVVALHAHPSVPLGERRGGNRRRRRVASERAHAVTKGVGGRFSRKEEKELEHDIETERELTASVTLFLRCLSEAFPIIREIRDGKPSYGGAVRKSKTTMLTSSSMLRGLAGAYYLTVKTDTLPLPGKTPEQKAKAFAVGLSTLVDAMTVDPTVGVWEVTVGALRSAVVNDLVRGAAMSLPARSVAVADAV